MSYDPVVRESAAGVRRGALGLVADRTFGALFWGKLLSSAGVWMQGVTAAVVVYQGTGSATAVSLVSIAQAAPQLVLGPWAGSLADRGDRSRQILAGRVLCGLGSGLLAVFFAVAEPGPHALVAVVFTCSFLVGTGFVVGGPAMQSVIPDLVRPDELRTAMTLNTTPMTTARIVGPALGALVLGWAGPAAAFAVSAAPHVVFLGLLLWVARLPARADVGEGAPTSMRAGLRYLRTHPRLLVMLGGTALVGVGTEPSLTLAPALSVAVHGDVTLAGALTLAFGVGALLALVGSSVAARRVSVLQSAWLGLALLIGGLGVSTAVAAPAWAFGCFALAGAGFSWGMAGFSSLLQAESDPAFRGRVMAWWLIAFLGCRPLSSAATGVLTDLTSVRVTFPVTGVVLALAALLLAAALRVPGVSRVNAE